MELLIAQVSKRAKDFFQSLEMDMNCPIYNAELTRSGHKFSEDTTNKIINLANLQKIQVLYKLITASSTLNMAELKAKLDDFKGRYKKAKEQHKKLLIAVGEVHTTNESLFFEMIIALFLKQEGITRLLTETSESELKKLQETYNRTERFMSTSFCQQVLDMDVIAIDPINGQQDIPSMVQLRNKKINEAISQNDDSDALAIVGETHLLHIVPSKEIQDKFVVVPVSVGHDISVAAKNMYGDALLHQLPPDVKPSKEFLNMRLSKSLESFSINKLVEIAYALDGAGNDQELYQADFAEDTEACKGFDVSHEMSQIAGIVYDKYSGDL